MKLKTANPSAAAAVPDRPDRIRFTAVRTSEAAALSERAGVALSGRFDAFALVAQLLLEHFYVPALRSSAAIQRLLFQLGLALLIGDRALQRTLLFVELG